MRGCRSGSFSLQEIYQDIRKFLHEGLCFVWDGRTESVGHGDSVVSTVSLGAFLGGFDAVDICLNTGVMGIKTTTVEVQCARDRHTNVARTL